MFVVHMVLTVFFRARLCVNMFDYVFSCFLCIYPFMCVCVNIFA